LFFSIAAWIPSVLARRNFRLHQGYRPSETRRRCKEFLPWCEYKPASPLAKAGSHQRAQLTRPPLRLAMCKHPKSHSNRNDCAVDEGRHGGIVDLMAGHHFVGDTGKRCHVAFITLQPISVSTASFRPAGWTK
jgi:hypothetical protein